jgi:hypothetical protein
MRSGGDWSVVRTPSSSVRVTDASGVAGDPPGVGDSPQATSESAMRIARMMRRGMDASFLAERAAIGAVRIPPSYREGRLIPDPRGEVS